MASAAEALTTVAVALLGRDDACRAQLKKALEDLGADVVHEGDVSGVDCAGVIALGPSVVLVNLEAGGEDALDGLDALFDDPSINVVFNEAETSSQLSGWDLARWARHLAAKVLGGNQTVPPPPAGAEALPIRDLLPRPGALRTPEQEAGEVAIESFAAEAANSETAVPASFNPASDGFSAGGIDGTPPAGGEASDDAAGYAFDPTAAEREPTTVAVMRELHGGEHVPDDFNLDFSEIEQSLAGVGERSVPDPVTAPLGGSREPPPPRPATDVAAPVAAAFDTDLDDVDHSLDASVAALAAQFDAQLGDDEAGARRPESTGLDLDLDLEFEFDAPVAEPEAAADSSAEPLHDAAGSPGLPDLDLDLDLHFDAAEVDVGDELSRAPPSDEPVDRGPSPALAGLEAETARSMTDDAAAQSSPAPDVASAGELGFGDLSLAPVDEDTSAAAPAQRGEYDFSSLGLSLAPLDDESEDSPADASLDEGELAAVAVDAEPAPTIPRVIVLGASIGGPDALRTFLGCLPPDFPALFLLAQHLDNGFFSRLATQLQKVCKLPIRVADDGAGPAASGQVVVVPSSQRFSFGIEGEIDSADHVEPPRYKPCIDDLMRDVAGRFGSRATAIVFSGMAGDAIEGAVQITNAGGEVWAQDPASCVVSSMVDGARARGVVEFIGSPRELAERCIERYGRRG